MHADKFVVRERVKNIEKCIFEKQIYQINKHVKDSIDKCSNPESGKKFYEVEKEIIQSVYQFGALLLQLYLVSVQRSMNYESWRNARAYYLNTQLKYRTLKTFFGKVTYGRYYMEHKQGGNGLFPLDKELGLSRDGFSPVVIKLVTNLSTRMSFNTAHELFKRFCHWAPSTEAIQRLVLGLGREANGYMEEPHGRYDGDGEILVIEVDGKATPTATKEELEKRRGTREKDKRCNCKCQRHRGRCKRRRATSHKRRKRGDKSKNGRSITLVAMYTLKKGDEGLLHGPINKKIWGSYAARNEMMKWAREQALKRGFDPISNDQIHIVIDGEKTLYSRMSEYFQKATFVLDIRHLEEKIWKTGRAFHAEGSEELAQWVEEHRTLLYDGRSEQLLEDLKRLLKTFSTRAKRDAKKREGLKELIRYIEPRLSMMRYKELIEQDLVIASGVIEGAVRYVIGERMDCSGMRWIPQRAEALLHLRCIELNGEWEQFFDWAYQRWAESLAKGDNIIVRTNDGIDLGEKYAEAA